MKKLIFSIIALFTVAISLSYAYADEFRMPFDEDFLVDHWVDVVFTPDGEGGADLKVIQTSLFHFDNLSDVPESIQQVILDEDGDIVSSTTTTLKYIAEQIMEPEPEPTEAEKLGITEETMERLEEKRAELEQLFEDASTCKAYGTEGNSMFQQYLEERITKDKVDFKNLPMLSQEKALIKAHEACRVFFEVAVHISDDPAMLNKFKAQQLAEIEEIKRLAELEVDTVYTDPITEEDIAETIETAEEHLIKYPDFYKNPYGECEPAGSDRCLNRGGLTLDDEGNVKGADCGTTPNPTGPPTVVCPLKDYNAMISSAISAEENYTEIEKLVCDKYLNQYQHLVERIQTGDETAELPLWLAHCDISVVDENE